MATATRRAPARKTKTGGASPADATTTYARAVVAGRVVAGPYVRAACARHLRDLKEGAARGLAWRPEMATRVLNFFEGALLLENGQPFVLQPWQKFILGSIFGWYRGEFRRFRTAYVESGKGSGKSPLAAGTGLYALVSDGEPAAEVYSAATTRDQASIVFNDAKNMAMASSVLSEVLQVDAHVLSTNEIPPSVFRALSAEHRGLDGKRPHVALVDELHEHPTSQVVDKIRAGTKGRRNALIFEITNSGFDRTSVCWHHHEYSVRIVEGTVEDDSWFAYVCALDAGDDWRDEKVWPKANPNLGVSLHVQYLSELVREAAGMPSKQNIVRRLNFCEWTEQAERAIDMEVWARGNVAVDEAKLKGRRCMIGLDAASTSDLSAEVLLFGPDDDGFYDVVPRFWIPEESLAAASKLHAEEYRLKLLRWAEDEWITLTPGNVTDYDFIESEILQDAERYELVELGFDRWGLSQLTTHLVEKLGEKRVVGVGQGFKDMTPAVNALMRILTDGKLRHGGHPVLTWMATNLALEQDAAGNLKPSKKKSAEKIDGMSALLNAISRSIVAPEGGSIYETRGVRILGDTE